MNKVCAPNSRLDGLVPYDPKYLPAEAFMSANENPRDVSPELRHKIEAALTEVPFNRYPDPMANGLRDLIALANGLEREQVIIGNGGDELLFNTALAWGGPGRRFLNFPPTFSAYETNAILTGTEIVDIPRMSDDAFSIDEEAAMAALSDTENPINYVIIASPNNPTGLRAPTDFLERLLNATNALVLVDEAYFEFSRSTMRPYLDSHENLAILRTFSKAFSLAGLRVGYILANKGVIDQYAKVRQPYSVDAMSQAVASVIYENRSEFEPGVKAIIEERMRMMEALKVIPGVKAFPSDSNWILFKIDDAAGAWQYLYDRGVLIRDFSTAPLLEGTLRVTVGTTEQNDKFLSLLKEFALRREDA